MTITPAWIALWVAVALIGFWVGRATRDPLDNLKPLPPEWEPTNEWRPDAD